MCDYVRVDTLGDTSLVAGDVISRGGYELVNEGIALKEANLLRLPIYLGTIRAALHTDSWLSAASFKTPPVFSPTLRFKAKLITLWA